MTQTAQTMTDILDLKDITPLNLTWLWAVLFLLAFLLFLGLGTLLYFWWKKKNASLPQNIQTPLQIALQKLEGLSTSGLLESGQVRRFYFALSEIYREFIENELNLMACETTLEELRPQLKSSPDLNPEDVKDALWLLELGEMAKFAKWIPPQEDIAHSIELTRSWMHRVAKSHQEKLKQEASLSAGGSQ